MNTEVALVDQGLAAEAGPDKAREHADVDRWWKELTAARKFDADARRQYAKDRRYARGDSGFEVDDNIVGTNIDILESFLYAKDPDVDVLPARSCRPPSMDAIRDAAEEVAGVRDGEIGQVGSQAAMQAVQMGMPPEEAVKVGAMAENAAMEERIKAEFERLQQRYARRLRTAKEFAETVEIIVSKLWRDAGLKGRGRRLVRSSLTIGIGVLKASWQERTAPSPETVSAINDLQRNIKECARLREEMAEAVDTDLDAKTAEYQRQLQALQGQAERVIARGFVCDQVAGEDFQVATGYQIANHLDAPWNAHRIPMLRKDAKTEFELTDEQIGQATGYGARKPVMVRNESANVAPERDHEATEADGFVTSGSATAAEGGGDWVMVWEIWDRIGGHVLTMIEGMKCWAKAPFEPQPTTRFYPFFVLATSEVDGQRHPQSPVARAAKLIDEYNRIASAEAEHRRRILPKVLFNKGQIGADQMTKIMAAGLAEYVGVETTIPTTDFSSLFYTLTYPALDPALYDRSRIVKAIERIFGVEEALAGAVTVAKTATEAQISANGREARTGGRRDALEALFQELAQYTAEVARANLSVEDAIGIAGPDALWPEYSGPDDLNQMVQIEIRAGSSGKPNTSAEREAWAQQLPILRASIEQIGALRTSLPSDVADSLEKLLQITADRSGDRIDVDQLIPKAGPAPVSMVPPAGGDPANDPNNPTGGELPAAA